MSTPPNNSKKANVVGVRITRGVALSIPPGGMVIHGDEDRLEVKQFHLSLNMATEWLEIAMENLERADGAHNSWLALRGTGADSDELLNQEFKASMQAIVAAGTFFEALYSATREALPPNLRATASTGRGKSKRTAVVAEQLRRGFGLRRVGTANLTSVVSEVYRFRDESVHPSAVASPPAIHPLLGAFVERRVAMFTFPNAKLIVRAALAYAKILPTVGLKQGPMQCHELARYLLATCEPLFSRWESKYGEFLESTA